LPKTGIKVYEMLEKVLVIEPVIRWASIANIIVNAKVHSFKVSVQVSFALGWLHYTDMA